MLLENKNMKAFVDMYAQDQNLFFDHYAQAHIKMSELGCEDKLLSEFENNQPRYRQPAEKGGIILGSHTDP